MNDDKIECATDGQKSSRPLGILRLDIGKPRRSSGGSVEFRNQPELLGEIGSPTNVVSPQLSVTWAFPQKREDRSTVINRKHADGLESINHESIDHYNRIDDDEDDDELKARRDSRSLCPLEIPEHNSDHEDYSVSVTAIMQRRASTRRSRKKSFRGSRRASSPMAPIIGGYNERRRSSVYTTSSGETAISFDDGTNQDSTQEQIFENIRLHKEVLQSVKLQPWSMRRKLRLVRQAKEYIARHEGALQERFAMSRSTRDLFARIKIIIATKLQHCRRELANVSTVLIPWEHRIKEIESHFGSVVASYFTFLRWLFWVNIVIAAALIAFVVTPELFAYDPSDKNDSRKNMSPEETSVASNLITIWDFEGYLKYSPLFYGYYSDSSVQKKTGYKLPLAYFLTGLVVYLYSFVATLRKMAENSRTSKLSSKDDECVFTWKLFTGWDFMIGHGETAHNRVASVVLGFKEALLEEAEKKKDKRNWKIITLRVIVNILVLCLLSISAFAVVFVVSRSTEKAANTTWWRRNEITIVMTLISYFFPMFFEGLGILESYHPRQQLRRQLARIMVLNLLNLYSLIFALFDKIREMTGEMKAIRVNITNETNILNMLFNRTATTAVGITITNDMYNSTPMNLMRPTYDLTSISVMEYVTEMFNELSANIQNQFTTPASESLLFKNGCTLVEVDCDIGVVNATLATITTAAILWHLTSNHVTDRTFNITTPENNLYPTTTYEPPFFNFSDYYGALNDSTSDNDTLPWNLTELSRSTRDLTDSTDFEDSDLSQFSLQDYFADMPSYSTDDESNLTTIFDDRSNITELLETTIATIRDTLNITDDYEYELTTESRELLEEMVTEAILNITQHIENAPKPCYAMKCPVVDSTTEDDYYDSTSPTFTTELETETTTTLALTTTISTTSYSTPDTAIAILDEMLTTTQAPLDPAVYAKFYDSSQKNYTKRLRKLCWETMFGQELVKLTVMDLIVTVLSTLMVDFFRALFVRFMNKFWCWDLEKTFPKYGDFKIAENILHLVNNQGLVWMGMFFSPGLAILNLFKLVVILYMRSWAVLTCNVPHEVVFRASRSNNFYLALLLTMLFLCVLPVAFAIVWLEPSWHCGPFSNNTRIYLLFTETLREVLPSTLHGPLNYIASPSTVIPLLMLLILIIYYLVSLTNALREANQDLKLQLRRERTEERRKMFKMAENNPGTHPRTLSARWKKVLDQSPLSPSATAAEIDEEKNQARKELLARIMKKALRKGSGTSEDDSNLIPADDNTDNEQHESLPHDHERKRDRPKKKRVKQGKVVDAAKSKPVNSWMSVIKSAESMDKTDKTAIAPKLASSPTNKIILKKNSPSKATKVSESNVNFKIVNEKTASNNSTTEPVVFKFDEVMKKLQEEQEDKKLAEAAAASEAPKDEEYVSDDQSSYREIRFVTMDNIDRKKSDSDISECKTYSSLKEEKPPKDAKALQAKDAPKGMKKLNSFFALVREAVQNKKADSEPPSPEGSDKEPTQFYQSAVARKSLEKAAESFRRNSRKPAPTDRETRRQDSSGSIWSDNIPVITISKTESDECILGEGAKDGAKYKKKSNSKIESPSDK